MTPNEYITANYTQIKHWLSGVTKQGNQSLAEDLVQEVILIFLEHPKAQDAVDTDTVRFFLVRIALNQWRSSTSPFHYQYRDSFLDFPDDWDETLKSTEYDIQEDLMTEVVIQALDLMYQHNDGERYEAIMIMMYYSMGANYSAVGRKLDMPHTTIRKIVLRGQNKLKQHINKLINNGTFRIDYDFSSSWDFNSSSTEQQTISLASQILKSRYFDTI